VQSDVSTYSFATLLGRDLQRFFRFNGFLSYAKFSKFTANSRYINKNKITIEEKTMKCQLISKMLGVVLIVSAISALAESIKPNFDSATEILTVPNVVAIGAKKPIKASIGSAGDVDYYALDAVAGRTYVLELFDVANNLVLVSDSRCDNTGLRYSGIYPTVFDPARNEIVRRCAPYGAGNVHTLVQFTAGVTGTHYIRVAPHAKSVVGTYSLRILPKYDEPNAVWDSDTLEPNNRLANAYPIKIGSANALTSWIEERERQFSTNYRDLDWYRFSAKAGQTFVVELFDVANNLALVSDHICIGISNSSYNYSGIYPVVYDPAGNQVAKQCRPNGTGDIHNFTTFTSGIDGDYFIMVAPHAHSVSGSYSIRVLEQ